MSKDLGQDFPTWGWGPQWGHEAFGRGREGVSILKEMVFLSKWEEKNHHTIDIDMKSSKLN